MLILLVLISFSGGSAFSLYMNAEFGASRVGELGRWVAIICDLFKISLSGALLFFQLWFSRFIGLIGIIAFAILSIFCSYGFYIQNIDQKAGKHRAVQKLYHSLQDRKTKLTQALDQLGQHRSIKALQKDIDAHKQDIIYTDKRRSRQCQNATIDESRAFCDRLRKLEVALEQASFAHPRIARIQGELARIQQQLEGIDLTIVTRKADPFAQSFGNADRFNLYFNLFLAFLIEIATTAGLPVMMVLLRTAEKRRQDREIYQAIKNDVAVENKSAIPDAGVRGLNCFLIDETISQPEGFVASTALRERYLSWCQGHSAQRTLSIPQIGAYMVQLGYKRERRKAGGKGKRQTGYAGLILKA